MKIVCSLLGFIFFSIITFGQTWPDTLAKIEQAFSRYQPRDPGCQLSISRNGEIIFSKAWGMADLEHGIPLTTSSIIEAGSVSKQFTAAAILLLEQQGKLSLEDDVRKYLPELPDYGTTIKLRHMMHHTSGLKDWGAIAFLTGWPRGKKAYTNEDALEIISHQKSLNNKPGDEFIYSNSNYNLFAIIVQRVSGLTLAEFTRKYIFEPAHMIYTEWRDNPNRIVKNRAIAYDKVLNAFQTNMPNEYVYGNGGLLTTTEDLLKWNDFYLQGKLGTSSLLAKQTSVEAFNNKLMNDYAAGLFIQKSMGWNTISHNGATAGYRAYLEAFPDLNLSIAFLSNSSQFGIALVNSIRNIFVLDKSEPRGKNEATVPASEERWNAYTGWYRNDRDGSGIQLSLADNKLMMDNRTQLVPKSESQFISANDLIDINNTKGFQYIIPNKDTIHYTKAVPIVSAVPLGDYEGKYFSEETNSSLIIQQKNGGLVLHVKAGIDYPLIPTYNDAFKMVNAEGNLYFIRARVKNKVETMKISVSRARNVEFKKL